MSMGRPRWRSVAIVDRPVDNRRAWIDRPDRWQLPEIPMLDRREVLKAAGAGMVSMAIPRASLGSPADPTWLSYAIDAEQFWKNLPFLERLRKLAQAGFTRYEFSRWKTKDIEAIARLNEELGIQAILFTGYSVLSSPRWKEGLIESIGDAVELAPR